jgi:hypothetical protein
MSAHVDTGEAALACMRAALEAVDLGARGGLETLGVAAPEPIAGLYHRTQFAHKDLQEARRRVQDPARSRLEDREYVAAFDAFNAQDHTRRRMERRQAGHAEIFKGHHKRPMAAFDVDEWPAGGRSGVRDGGAVEAAEERARKRRREMQARHQMEVEAERRRERRERETAELERRARDGELYPDRLAGVLGMEDDWLDAY